MPTSSSRGDFDDPVAMFGVDRFVCRLNIVVLVAVATANAVKRTLTPATEQSSGRLSNLVSANWLCIQPRISKVAVYPVFAQQNDCLAGT